MKLKRFLPVAATAAASALFLSACGGGTSATGEDTSGSTGGDDAAAEETVSGTLTGIGASSQKAAMDAWTAGVTSVHPDLQVQYSPDGSGAGRENFLAGNAQFAGSDAYLDDEELAAAPEVCGPDGAYEFPVYISPIAIAFNLEGVDSLNMSAELIAKVFAGEVTNWSDEAIAAENEGVELPDTPITAVHRSDESGTTENFTDYLAAAAGDAWGHEAAETWPEEFGGEAAQGTDGVVSTVSGTDGAIGYADASAVGSLSTVAVGVGEEYVPYSPEAAAAVVDASERVEGRGEGDLALELARDTTESGTYPIVLVSYHLVCSTYPDQETVDLVTAWESYVISEEGQQTAADNAGSAPISETMRGNIQSVLDTITVAS
ncbi:phosphate ABC transporter substrate-binding protein PstS [Brevibacterium litoralis]|uniref:phosphate ABC transporter substrate-binding protein PstS n=1 Tax=Brevibacterium litoralis TaxID=3138935 RepID=UPI0032EC3614